MPVTKKLSDWEKTKGFIVTSENPSKSMTEEEFDSISINLKRGVDFDARTTFLEANGYEVTRENMIADLSAKPKE